MCVCVCRCARTHVGRIAFEAVPEIWCVENTRMYVTHNINPPTHPPTKVNGFTQLPIWARYGFNKTNDKPVANADLWRVIAHWAGKCHGVTVCHVGAGDETVPGNTAVDRRMLHMVIKQL